MFADSLSFYGPKTNSQQNQRIHGTKTPMTIMQPQGTLKRDFGRGGSDSLGRVGWGDFQRGMIFFIRTAESNIHKIHVWYIYLHLQ